MNDEDETPEEYLRRYDIEVETLVQRAVSAFTRMLVALNPRELGDLYDEFRASMRDVATMYEWLEVRKRKVQRAMYELPTLTLAEIPDFMKDMDKP